MEKYKSKYRILYRILQQVSKEPTRLSPPEDPTSEITPSLAALDDAPALKQKEWRRGKPGKDIPQQYSTISGCLTLTPPRYEDMRMDLTLNITPEGSLCNLPTAVGGTETMETPKTQLKVATKRDPTRIESLRRIERTREASREDAIASTRHFFATVNRQNETTTELPVETTTTTDVSGGNAPMNIPVVSSASIETETTEKLEVLGPSFQMDLPPDLLLLLLVGHECGYNVSLNNKLMNPPEKAMIQEKVIHQNPMYCQREYLMSWAVNGGFYILLKYQE